MNLLIVTQKLDMNDSYFGFFHDWLIEFSKNCKKVTVISLETYSYQLPVNVTVLSLGKESGKKGIGRRFHYMWLLWKYSFIKRNDYDAVFCHMSPLYVIGGWGLWSVFRKKIALWYVHRNVDEKLYIATFLSDIIFTATRESYNIQSKKVKYMGQAVDISRFSRPADLPARRDSFFKIITVGRITPIKRLEVLIEATEIIKSKGIPVQVTVVGPSTLYMDIEYEKELKQLLKERNLEKEVLFVGAIPNKDLPAYYWDNDVSVNLCPTGGLDKVVLEAMAAGLPVVVANQAFEKHLNGFVSQLLCKDNDPEDCARKLISLYGERNYAMIGKSLFKEVKERSSLDALISAIVKNLCELV